MITETLAGIGALIITGVIAIACGVALIGIAFCSVTVAEKVLPFFGIDIYK
jgi:hypothetical protein